MSQQSDYIQRIQYQQQQLHLQYQQRLLQQQTQAAQPPPQAAQQPPPQPPQAAQQPPQKQPAKVVETIPNLQTEVNNEMQTCITKEQVKDYLRQWIRVENEIGTLTQEIKKRKLIHQQLSQSLLSVMRKNEIDCFDITNGKIVYSKTKSRPPLNKGQLKSALLTYYKDDAESANSLNEFLVASRVEKVKEAIKMKIPK
jgi:hypothetical protein